MEGSRKTEKEGNPVRKKSRKRRKSEKVGNQKSKK